MNTELWILVAATLFCVALPLLYVPLYARQVGMGVISGNREEAPAPTGAAGRGARAHRNLLENLLPFAVAVLVARVIGVSDSVTVLGAWVFLGGRLVHVASYLAGIPGIRTLGYFAGVTGTVAIVTQLH